MRALQLNGPGEKFNLVEVPVPVASQGTRLIRVKSASLNHRDLWIQKGQYANLQFPIILGSDACGVDVSNGHEREVVIYPAINWGTEQSHQGVGFRVIGLPDQGTFAEYICVPQENVFDKPPHLRPAEASSLPVAGLTAYRALFTRGGIKPNDTILITGIGGGAAHMALLFAKSIGTNVFVTSGSDEKIRRAIEMGAVGGINYNEEYWVASLKSMSQGFDIILDSAAGSSFNKLIDLIRPGGKLVFFGETQGKIESIDPRKIFWNQISILGTTLGSPIDFDLMIKHVNKFNIKPVINSFHFTEINEAMELMKSTGQFGKIVLSW
ncbi:MAG TPA: zinc-binding dehydrogenase [Cytophagaceae bacterium]